MAVAVATVGTKAPPTVTNTFTCTKPASLAVGDLMVVMYGVTDGANPTVVAKTGWTSFAGVLDAATIYFANNVQIAGQWKIADSADVAASNFSWGTFAGGASDANAGLIWRITGHDPTTPINAFNGAGVLNSANPSFNNGISPSVTDCLLLFGGHSNQNTSGAATSNYAIATNNPTWSENLDTPLTTECWFAASAQRSASGSTGNSSCTIGAASTTDSIAYLVAINPAPVGPANLKSLDTNLKANIKSMDGNLIGNMKSFDGNS